MKKEKKQKKDTPYFLAHHLPHLRLRSSREMELVCVGGEEDRLKQATGFARTEKRGNTLAKWDHPLSEPPPLSFCYVFPA